MRNLTLLGLAALLTTSLGCSGEPAPSENQHNTDQPTETVVETQGGDHDGGAESAAEQSAEMAAETITEVAEGDWSAGDTIPSGMAGVKDIQILEVHKNGSGDVCGNGRTATLKYKAMLADGKVLDPGTRPFSFRVGGGQAIKGWDVVVSKMRIGDSFTILLPQQLAYGPSKGDLKFDMELLSVQ